MGNEMSEVKEAVKEFALGAGAVALALGLLAANIAPLLVFRESFAAACLFCLIVLAQAAVQLALARRVSGPGAGLVKAVTYAAALDGVLAASVWFVFLMAAISTGILPAFTWFGFLAAVIFTGILLMFFVVFCLRKYEAAAMVDLPLSGVCIALGLCLPVFGLYPLWSVPWIFQLKAMPKAMRLAAPKPAV